MCQDCFYQTLVKQVIVQLFEWTYEAVANECENYLGPKGFCGVQV